MEMVGTEHGLDELQAKAAKGDVAAIQNLALYFELGGAGKPNLAEARKYWEMAAKLGDPVGLLNFAEFVRDGKGGVADPKAAQQLMSKAADKGMISAKDRIKMMNAEANNAAKNQEFKLANKILVIDDSGTMRRMLVGRLQQAGYVVAEAADGQEGLAAAKTLMNLKLIITDINMPKMDGLAMIRALKATKQTKDIPICVCSTESSADIIKQAKELHVAGWLLKPPQEGAAEAVATKFLGVPRVRAK